MRGGIMLLANKWKDYELIDASFVVDKEEYKDDVLKDYVQVWNGGSMFAFVCGLFGKKDMLSESERKELKKKIDDFD